MKQVLDTVADFREKRAAYAAVMQKIDNLRKQERVAYSNAQMSNAAFIAAAKRDQDDDEIMENFREARKDHEACCRIAQQIQNLLSQGNRLSSELDALEAKLHDLAKS